MFIKKKRREDWWLKAQELAREHQCRLKWEWSKTEDAWVYELSSVYGFQMGYGAVRLAHINEVTPEEFVEGVLLPLKGRVVS